MKTILPIFLILILLVSSCIEPIDIDSLPQYVNKITINSELNNQEKISIKLSNSTNAYKSQTPASITDATIVFRENGNLKFLTYNPTTTAYEGDFIPQAGNTYNISIQHPNFPAVSSQVQIPEAHQNKQVALVINGGIDATGVPSDLLSVTWKDNPNLTNYYEVRFTYYSETVQMFIPFEYQTIDPVLTGNSALKTNNGGYIFDDRLFNGQLKTLSAVAPFGLVGPGSTYKYQIELKSLSEDYFKYLTTLQLFRDEQDFNTGIFENPIVVHSNVSGGLGIFGGQFVSRDTLN